MKLVTAAQMRAMDRAAIEDFGLPGIVLMENAGTAVVAACAELLTQRGGYVVRVFAGKGNNGGDGFVVARHLHNAGCEVAVALLARGEELRGDAATNHAIAAKMGIPIVEITERNRARLRKMAAEADLIVDAVLGTGLSGEVTGLSREAIRAINGSPAPVVAVDIPSGVHADTGAILGVAVRADLTVTFGLPKIGLYQHPGAALAGDVRTADISLPASLTDNPDLRVELATAPLMRSLFPARAPAGHKGDCGRVAIVAGSRGFTGACALAAKGALRAGAGLVTMAMPDAVAPVIQGLVAEAISRPLPSTPEGTLAAAALDELLELNESMDAVVLGPGLTQHVETQTLIREVVARCRAPLVADADAINALARDAAPLLARRGPTVLTPHPGEFARLRHTDIASVQADRVNAATAAAREYGCVVLLKGAGTVTADADGRVVINPTGNDGLATGGTGDVLAGIIGGLLAGGAAPFEAAALGAYWHGLAADLIAERRSARTLIAGDLLDYLAEAEHAITHGGAE